MDWFRRWEHPLVGGYEMPGSHHLFQAEWSSARDSRHLVGHTEHSLPWLLQRQMGHLALVFIPLPSGATVQNRGEQTGWVGFWELIWGSLSEYKCGEQTSDVKGTVLQREITVERVNWRECGSPRLQGFRVKEKRLLWLTRILLRSKRIRLQ